MTFARHLFARPRLALVVIAALAACCVLAPGISSAFRLDSSFGVTSTRPVNPRSTLPTRFIHWDLREFDNCQIPYSIDAAGCRDSLASGGFQAIVNSFNTWGATFPTPITFTRRPNAGTNRAGNDAVNLIAFDSTNANGFMGPRLSGILALTYVWVQNPTGRIQESDIIFNDRDWQWNNTGDNFDPYVTTQQFPFDIGNGDTLRFRVNGGPIRTAVFDSTNITVAAATPNQVVAVMAAAVPASENFFFSTVATPVDYDTTGLGATATNFLELISARCDGQGSFEIVSGTGALPEALGFPAGRVLTRQADIQTVCTHEIGHFIGVAHSSDNGTETNATYSNAVMYAFAPETGTKRPLTADDQAAMNFLYTPDYGDAPDPTYQTKVHTATNSRLLSGLQLHAPKNGPGHLFNLAAIDSLKFECLGTDMDDSQLECEARVVNNDNFDDGVTFPTPLVRGITNPVQVKISYRDPARYSAADPNRVLYFSGYFDFNGDGVFDAGDREIWWRGVPGTTIAASPNWTGTLTNFVGQTLTIDFDEIPSLIAANSGYARFRLDVGEDEGRVNNYNGDLGPAIGVAQFGEVEDYPFTTVDQVTATLVSRFDAQPSADGVTITWALPGGNSGATVNLYRRQGTDAEQRLASGLASGYDGGQYVDHAIAPGTSYTYRITVVQNGKEATGPTLDVHVPDAQLRLAGVVPNPVGRVGTVQFSLPRAGRAHLALYSVSGQLVRTLADREFRAGEQSIAWDGADASGRAISAGIYFLRMDAGGRSLVTRAVVVR